MIQCHKCGTKLDADDEFCPECGARIRQPTEAMPAREAQKIVFQQAQPKKHRFLTVLIIIIVLIFLFRACASFSSEPQVSRYKPTYTQEITPADERLISIETPPPRVNPIPEPEPMINKDAECSGVAVKIIDACFSCGIVDCGLLAKVENKGSKPIISFVTRTYVNEMNKDEEKSYEPLAIGMSAEIGVHKQSNEIRMVELVPVIVVGSEEVVCEGQKASYGNAYGSPFGECGIYTGSEPAAGYGYEAESASSSAYEGEYYGEEPYY